jgi:hypothetical protein
VGPTGIAIPKEIPTRVGVTHSPDGIRSSIHDAVYIGHVVHGGRRGDNKRHITNDASDANDLEPAGLIVGREHSEVGERGLSKFRRTNEYVLRRKCVGYWVCSGNCRPGEGEA